MAVDVTVESNSAGRGTSLSFRLALTGQEAVVAVAVAVAVVVPVVVVRVGKSEWERIGEGEPGGKGTGWGLRVVYAVKTLRHRKITVYLRTSNAISEANITASQFQRHKAKHA